MLRIRTCALLVAALLLVPAAQASADLNANTDDSNISTPTGYWTYANVTTAQVSSFLDANGARLTDVEPFDVAAGTWTVTMVRNAGAYAVPGWWWYVGLTKSNVNERLQANGARLIHAQPYLVNGALRFAVIMVPNTGALAREWYWSHDASPATISNHVNQRGTRLTDLESYGTGTAKRYAFVSVRNTGADNNAWYWWYGQSASALSTNLKDAGARLIDLDRSDDGTYTAVAVKGGESHDNAAWWWYRAFKSPQAVLDYANQLGVRVLDIETYVLNGVRRYDAVFIDNANAPTRRIRGIYAQRFLDLNGNPTRGIFQAYLKRVGNHAPSVDLNAHRRAETASSLKALHLLHTMRRVHFNGENLGSTLTYYNYPSSRPWPGGLASNACPRPADETTANRMTNWSLERGVDEMMSVSDNRTTRGVVLRYGGFAPLNATAAWAGLTNTVLRHNIGCAYLDVSDGKIKTSMRNDTTARDLAAIYEGVWSGTTLPTGTARSEFLESANPATGADDLQAIVEEEAAALGKPAETAVEFRKAIQRWGKGGSYSTCLPNAEGGCGQRVTIASGAGLIRLPIKTRGFPGYRNYVFARLVSDVPVPCWDCTEESNYLSTYRQAARELYREEIRSALATW
jgi:hypothetical protein